MSGAGSRWPDVRYRSLLPRAARSRLWVRCYAAVVGAIELGRDPGRRAAACARIERCLGVTPGAARRTFLASLVSEAREEADTVYFTHHEQALRRMFDGHDAPPVQGGASILVTLHLGSPIVGGYLYLCCRRALDCTVIARPLDAANPMPESKRTYALGKVAWVERLARHPFLETDAASIARAREYLLGGRTLYTPIDVPGDVAARSSTVTLLGERVRVAAGVTALARLTASPLQPIVTVLDGNGLAMRVGRPVAAASEEEMLAETMQQLGDFIRESPGEWWMWPYL